MRSARRVTRMLEGRFVRRLTLASAAAMSVALGASEVRAGCPDKGVPEKAACEPYGGFLMPSAMGFAYFPLKSGGLGPWLGGGAELVAFTWSSNSDGFGPSQGKIRFDVGGMASTRDGTSAMVFYRGGAAVSFEGNAGRSFLIPYFGGSLGGFNGKDLGGHAFADAELGVYLLYLRGFILDAEGAFMFPFTDFDRLAGPKVQLTVSFALW
jgi:hypothetical protein